MSPIDRFNAKWTPEPFSGCWLWIGACYKEGYGKCWIDGRIIKASRASWIFHNGKVPKHMCVLHRCDTPACVNPTHLFLGTQTDNIKDCCEKGRNPLGIQCGSSKLTEEEVIAIRGDTRTHREIARAFGVTQPQITKIKLKRQWRHLCLH